MKQTSKNIGKKNAVRHNLLFSDLYDHTNPLRYTLLQHQI